MTIAVILTWVIRVTRWALLFTFGLFLYRKFKLPSLPWIAAYFFASVIPSMLMPFLMSGLLENAFKRPLFGEAFYKTLFLNIDSHPEAYKVAAGIFKWQGLFGGFTYLLLTLLVVSEVIYIISSNTDYTIPEPLRLTLKLRERVNLVGILIVAITLISPFVTVFAVYRMSN